MQGFILISNYYFHKLHLQTLLAFCLLEMQPHLNVSLIFFKNNKICVIVFINLLFYFKLLEWPPV